MSNKTDSNNLQIRGNKKDFTHLSLVQELRADKENEGIVEGYAAVWDTVDSYNSRFQRGCFKKTLENRTHKIKLLWNHDIEVPIGKIEEIREDDHGLFLRAKLFTDIEKAKDVFTLIQGGAIDCFSFGFRTIKQKFENGVQIITEVMLGEVSPVVFAANQESKITGVRSEYFMETDAISELRQRGYRLQHSLDETLYDIWWGDSAEKINLVQFTLAEFSAEYLKWAQEVVDIQSSVRMDIDCGNELTTSVRKFLKDEDKTVEEVSQNTSLTVEEIRSLKLGKTEVDHKKISQLNASVLEAFNNVRSKAVETLCDELRAGINSAEAVRINALLQKSLHSEVDDVVKYMNDFRKKLNEVT